MHWSSLWQALKYNWGSIVSVAGLVISVLTLRAATKAKAAANAAKTEARRRNLSEDLHDAQTKSEQIGIFIRERRWDLVFLRSQEVTSACSLVLSRWTDELNAASRDQIRLARNEVSSICKVATRAKKADPSEQHMRAIEAAQRRLNEILSTELGAALRVIERSDQSK